MENSVKSFKHNYLGYHNCHSECQVDVLHENGKTIVMFTDLGVGTSVTNASEQLATEMINLLKLDPLETLWAEHYMPVKGVRGETLDQIEYTWTGTKYVAPEWRRVESIKKLATERLAVDDLKKLIMNNFEQPTSQEDKISPLGWYGDQPGVLYIAQSDSPRKYLVRGASEIHWESMWADTIKIGVGKLTFTPNPTADKIQVEQYLEAIAKVKVGPMIVSDFKNTNIDPDQNGLHLKDSSPSVDAYFDDKAEEGFKKYEEKTQNAFKQRMKV